MNSRAFRYRRFVVVAVASAGALLRPPFLCADDAAALMAEADGAYAKRTELSQDKVALVTYQRAAALGADKAPDANWKASRAAWWLARHSTKRAEKLLFYQNGIDLAQAALAQNPESIDAHFWLGVNLGSYGETKGVLKSLSLVKPIRRQMEEVLRLNPHYQGGGAYRVLGVVDYKVPGFMGGNRQRAREELEKARAWGPSDPFTHFYLAELYQLMGEGAKSKAELKTLKSLQTPSEIQPELLMVQEEAAKEFK